MKSFSIYSVKLTSTDAISVALPGSCASRTHTLCFPPQVCPPWLPWQLLYPVCLLSHCQLSLWESLHRSSHLALLRLSLSPSQMAPHPQAWCRPSKASLTQVRWHHPAFVTTTHDVFVIREWSYRDVISYPIKETVKILNDPQILHLVQPFFCKPSVSLKYLSFPPVNKASFNRSSTKLQKGPSLDAGRYRLH